MSGPGDTPPPSDGPPGGAPPPPPESPYAPPAAPLSSGPAPGQATGNPWERRDELGFVEAVVQNLKLFVLSPQEAYEQTREQGDYASPLIWYVMIAWVGSAIGQLWNLLLMPFYGSMFEEIPGMPAGMDAMMAPTPGSTIIGILFTPVWLLIAVFLWAGILHLVAMVIGVDRDSQTGFEGTFRAVAYSGVANVANVIPFVGGLIAGLWALVLTVLGIVRMHRTSEWKAIAVALIPVALCCVCFILLIVGMVGMIGAAQQ